MLKKWLSYILCAGMLLAALPFFAFGESEDGSEIQVPEGKEARIEYLEDEDFSTRLTLRRGEEVTVKFSEGAVVYLEIFEAPSLLKAEVLDAEGGVLETKVLEQPGHMVTVDVAGGKGITLWAPEEGWSLSTVKVYEEAFRAPLEESREGDLLVLLARTGDEWKLGGLLPQYAGENGLKVKVAYALEGDAYGDFCGLRTLVDMGVGVYPAFMGLKDKSVANYNQALTALGGEKVLLRELVRLLREVRPQVVVVPAGTGDFYEEALSEVMEEAVVLAGDGSKYPGTEAHQVERVYRLAAEGETVVSWEEPLVNFEGLSAREAAEAAYENYAEKRVFGYEIAKETAFELVYGEGAGSTSLIEGMDEAGFSQYVEPTFTPAPTDTPALTDTPAATDVPTPVPTVDMTAEAEEEAGRTPVLYAAAGVLAVAGVGCTVAGAIKKKKWAWTPAVAGVICACVLVGVEVRPEEEAEPTAAPTMEVTTAPTETPKATEEPTPEPTETPEPTATPDPWEELFSEEEECFSDFDEGHWQYRSENLYIDIERITTELGENKPLVYYVADIYMREYSSYRSGVRSYTAPWKFARTEKAVLAITGDNLVGEEKELKGCLIRKGKLYCDYGKADTLVIGKDMDLQVYYPTEVDSGELLDSGVRDTYSFGPILVRDGEINEDVGKHRVAGHNPRCGIGMVEPGHWVAITTDGRQGGYSVSIDLYTFAQLFVDNGCTVAYNLDGGSSVAMVFMGDILNVHAGHGTSDVMRPWTDALMWGYSESVPTVEAWTQYDGYR